MKLTDTEPLTARERRLTDRIEQQQHTISTLIMHNQSLLSNLTDMVKAATAADDDADTESLYADIARVLLDMLRSDHDEKTIYHALMGFDYLLKIR